MFGGSRESFRYLVVVALAVAGLAVVPGQALAGPIILGGDDLTDHGSNNGTANQEGWLYMEKALGNMSSNVSRPNDNSIAALGSSAAGGGAGNAIAKAAAPNGLTVTYYEGTAAINGFFSALAAGTVKPKIIWVAGDEASNDLSDPDGCSDSDPATTTEGEALAANAAAIENFVSSGGGLMSHGTCYPWVQALVPGLVVKTDNTGGTGDIALTPDGNAAFPGVTDAHVGAGPWHNYFEGNFGGLRVLARSKTVRDANGNLAAVFLGGGQVSFTPADVSISKSAPATAQAGSDLTYTMTVRNAGPGTATGVQVGDTMPGGLKVRSVSASQGSCLGAGAATAVCNLGNLANGAQATVTIVVRPTAAGNLTNTAAVAAGNDNTPANNQASATTRVTAASPDLVAARRPACLSIPNVVRDQRKVVPGAGTILLQTRQVDNPAQPLRTSIRMIGRGRIRSTVFRVNGKVTGRTVAVGLLRLGGGRTRPNKVTATVTLTDGRKFVLTQYMIILKCKVPTANCKLAAGGRRMTCSSLTPLSAIRARITVTRNRGETATGVATVIRGRYTATLRSSRVLTPGTYAYKHVLNTRNPRLRFYMIRLVTVR
jgi:uncharacterized repeat protein (TIGR01451 family)